MCAADEGWDGGLLREEASHRVGWKELDSVVVFVDL